MLLNHRDPSHALKRRGCARAAEVGTTERVRNVGTCIYSREATTKPEAMSSAPKRECQYAMRTVALPLRLCINLHARSRSVPWPS